MCVVASSSSCFCNLSEYVYVIPYSYSKSMYADTFVFNFSLVNQSLLVYINSTSQEEYTLLNHGFRDLFPLLTLKLILEPFIIIIETEDLHPLRCFKSKFERLFNFSILSLESIDLIDRFVNIFLSVL